MMEAELGRSGYLARLDASGFPANEEVCANGVWFTQRLLLGDDRDTDDIVTAVRKVQRAFAG